LSFKETDAPAIVWAVTDILEPNRTKDLIENELPSMVASRVEIEDANLVVENILTIPFPRRTKFRIDNAEPMFEKLMIETALPSLEKLLQLTVEANEMKSKRDTVAPHLLARSP
jgi:hypothetical protein